MPVQRFAAIPLDPDRILRWEGAEPHLIRARNPYAAAVADAAALKGVSLLRPVIAYQRWRVIALRHEKLMLEGGAVLSGKLISRHLAAAEEAVAVVCTIGEALEEAVAASFADDPAFATALDAVGSLAVQDLMAAAGAQFSRQAEYFGLRTTMPLSPGLEGWPLDVGQRQLFDLLGPAGAGVVVSSTGQMTPRKSVSLVLGIGRQVVSYGRPCDSCGLRTTCRHQEHYA